MAIDHTRLRSIKAGSLETLLAFVDNISFKIEIKRGPVYEKKAWHLHFVLPEMDTPQLKKVPLITDLTNVG